MPNVKIEHRTLNGVELRLCSVCKKWLSLKLFYKDKKQWDGLCHRCHNCRKEYNQGHHRANKEKHNLQAKKWQKTNSEKAKATARLWNERNPEKRKKSNRASAAKRFLTFKGRLTGNIKRAIYRCLKSGKYGHTFSILGYSVKQLKGHLTKTMPQGYCWEDYLAGKLHIDHIIPISVHNFKTTEDIDFKRCWALKNLQLLPAFENLSKGAKLDKHFQPSLLFD